MTSLGLIPTLARELRVRQPLLLSAHKRASVAVILRVTPGIAESFSLATPTYMTSKWTAQLSPQLATFLASPAASSSTPATCEILFMKRASRTGDPWSGNVAFPGGHRASTDADDAAAAVRECREEVGLDLDDSSSFQLLGRLDDRAVYARGRRRNDFVLCPFVYVQTTPITPRLTLQASEVAGVRWVPVADLSVANVDSFNVAMPFGLLPLVAALPGPVKSALGIATAFYPSVLLREKLELGRGGAEGLISGGTDLAARVASELATSAPTPSYDGQDNPSQSFVLWGLTLAAASDLLALVGRPRLNWPPIRFGSRLPDAFVAAICGVIELSEAVRGRRALVAVSTRHVAWAAAFAAVPVAIVWAAVAGMR